MNGVDVFEQSCEHSMMLCPTIPYSVPLYLDHLPHLKIVQ